MLDEDDTACPAVSLQLQGNGPRLLLEIRVLNAKRFFPPRGSDNASILKEAQTLGRRRRSLLILHEPHEGPVRLSKVRMQIDKA